MKQVFTDDEVDQLEADITILNELYKNGDPCVLPRTKKLISDSEYDLMRKRLEQIRPDSEALDAIGIDDNVVGAKKFKLSPPMTSIHKAIGTLSEREDVLAKWVKDCLAEINKNSPSQIIWKDTSLPDLCGSKYKDGTPVFAMSFKRDGCACSIQYEKGKLVSAALRPRDGINAVDIINHIRNVRGVPNQLKLPVTCSIRGELECLISVFEKHNADVATSGDRAFKNPRNMTAGTMNPAGDPRLVKTRGISFVAHSIEIDNTQWKTAIERAKWCNTELGVSFVRVEAFSYDKLAELEKIAKEVDYETDGIVIEVNKLMDGEAMGRHGNSPNGDPMWKLAWKFTEQTATPAIKDIVWETGRVGRVTPVAIFDAVRLAGTDVQRCTLHNLGFLKKFQAGVGAIIEIEKAGKIIPKALRTIKPAQSVVSPTHCPSCNAKLTIVEGDNGGEKTYDLVCQNSDACPAQNIGTLVHYLATVGVKGVAEANVTLAVNAGILTSFVDFYKLKVADWQKAGLSYREAILAFARIYMVDGADKIKDNARLLAAAEKSASSRIKIPMHILIAALGIPGASKGTGRELSSHFQKFTAIRNASVQDMEKASNIGSTTANSVYEWFKTHAKQVDELLTFVEPEEPKIGKFTGKTFVFTGSPVDGSTKEDWIKLVEEEGAKVSSSVSKNTNYVIVGAEAGQKFDKAKELKKQGIAIEIIEDLDVLKKMLGINVQDDRLF